MVPSRLAGPAPRDGPLHRLEARAKLASALVLILAASLLPPHRTWPFAALLALLAALLALSRLPFGTLLRRTAAFAPFVLTAVLLLPFTRPGDGTVSAELRIGGWHLRLYRAGLLAAKGVALKSLISALAVVLLTASTPFADLLHALQRWRFPRLLLAVIALLYRYLFLLIEEFQRLVRAASARNWAEGPFRVRLRAAGGIVGSLFLRTYARGERVYAAMLARGWDGRFRVPAKTRLRARDWAALGAVAAAAGGVLAGALLGGGP